MPERPDSREVQDIFSGIDELALELELPLQQLREFVNTIAKLTSEYAEEDYDKRVQSLLTSRAGLSGEALERELEALSQEHGYVFESIVPRVFHYSSVVMIYTAMEYALEFLRKRVEKERDLSRERERINLDAYKRFFMKCCGINLGVFVEWTQVKDIEKVRDCIVHCAGYVGLSRDRKHLENLARKGDSGIEIFRVLEVERRFVEKSTSVASTLVDWLLEQLRAMKAIAG